MTSNCNAITEYAEENQTVDETTWGHAGYGEAGSGITGRLMNKKVNKGGQTSIITDSRRFRPRAYIHRHKLHKLIEGQTRRGTNELANILLEIAEMVITPAPQPVAGRVAAGPIRATSTQLQPKKIFRTKPTVCADNFFFDDKMLNWIGENGFSSIGTCARNCLPGGIPKKYFHAEKHQAGCKYSRVAKMTNPIVVVKDFDAGFQRAHISFQSTSSANITTVNCLNDCRLFVELRERGKGNAKRTWGIEMNDGRRLYLSTYFTIDVADHLLKNAQIFYRTWKYWHAPMNHCFAMILCLIYSIYQECAEGKIEASWKIEPKQVKSFFEFREKLSIQMLSYSPKRELYPGDAQMRCVTSTTRVNRGQKRKSAVVDLNMYKKNKRYRTSRLSGDLNKLCHHIDSIERLTKPLVCAWCGERTYTCCTICKDESTKKKIPLHYNARGGVGKDLKCFYQYHDDRMFGLGKNDCSKLLGLKKGDWEAASTVEVEENALHIEDLSKQSGI